MILLILFPLHKLLPDPFNYIPTQLYIIAYSLKKERKPTEDIHMYTHKVNSKINSKI